MNKKCVMLVIGGMLLITGCAMPFSHEPITDFNPDTLDTRLLGTWLWPPDNLPERADMTERVFLHVGYAEDSPFLKCLCVWMTDDESGYVDFEGFSSSFAGETFLNLRWLNPLPESSEDVSSWYLIVKYHWTAERLEVALPSPAFIEDAIQAGRLQGSMVGKTFDQAIQDGHGMRGALSETLGRRGRITASQSELQAFFQQYGRDVFGESFLLDKFQD